MSNEVLSWKKEEGKIEGQEKGRRGLQRVGRTFIIEKEFPYGKRKREISVCWKCWGRRAHLSP